VTRARLALVLAAGLLLVALPSIARAQDDDPTAWHATLTPYAWAAGINGDVTVRGLDAEVSSSFIDVLEETDSLVGLEGHLEVTRGTARCLR
jgi:hypothetical protein